LLGHPEDLFGIESTGEQRLHGIPEIRAFETFAKRVQGMLVVHRVELFRQPPFEIDVYGSNMKNDQPGPVIPSD
jgi:hypothetical protein